MLKKLGEFKKDKRGNFAMMLVIAFPAIFGAIVMAVDVADNIRSHADLQNANDTAVLFAMRYYQVNERLPSILEVRDFLDTNFEDPILTTNISFDAERTEITLNSSTNSNFLLANYFGTRNRPLKAVSKAALGVEGILEFSLALDTTKSMQYDGRIQGLKVAANEFVNMIFDVADVGADVKGAIVPFARYVNLGMSNAGASWLNVPADIDTRQTVRQCSTSTPIVGYTPGTETCWPASTINHPATGETCYPATPPSCYVDDGVQVCSGGSAAYCNPGSAAWTQNISAGCSTPQTPIYGQPVETCNDVTTGQLYTWQGCVGSRNYPKLVRDAHNGDNFEGVMTTPNGPYVTCPTEVLPLTDVRSQLLAKINALVPDENTYIPQGVMWGSRTLTPQLPFTEGRSQASSTRKIRKALVVMTDGTNTVSPNNKYHNAASVSRANNLTEEACDEAKANDLEVYTITFGPSVDNTIKNLMKACATKNDMYIHASNSAALSDAFKDIADRLLSVRLTH